MEEEKEIEDLHKKVFLKLVRREQMAVFILSIAFFSSLIWYMNYIFKIAIFEYNVSTIISLGAIFSTFGSSLLAAAQAIGADKFDRVFRNIDIYYNDIVMTKPWRRWQFLNRTSKFKNFNSTIITTTLQNPSEVFDVGSHEIEVYIPTVLEDFYDLPTYYCYYIMKKNKRHFMTNTTKNKLELNGPNGYMRWSCIYDIWESVVIFRISRFITKTGIVIILCSIVLTIFYNL